MRSVVLKGETMIRALGSISVVHPFASFDDLWSYCCSNRMETRRFVVLSETFGIAWCLGFTLSELSR